MLSHGVLLMGPAVVNQQGLEQWETGTAPFTQYAQPQVFSGLQPGDATLAPVLLAELRGCGNWKSTKAGNCTPITISKLWPVVAHTGYPRWYHRQDRI